MAKQNTTETITYAAAVVEIEGILVKMNNAELDIDKLGGYVERATVLITICKEKLIGAQKQVEKVIKQEN